MLTPYGIKLTKQAIKILQKRKFKEPKKYYAISKAFFVLDLAQHGKAEEGIILEYVNSLVQAYMEFYGAQGYTQTTKEHDLLALELFLHLKGSL